MEELDARVIGLGAFSHFSSPLLGSQPSPVAPIRPVFGEVIYRPANHYNTLQLGYFHAKFQLGMDFSSRDSTRDSGLKIMEDCQAGFLAFSLPDGGRFSIDGLKIFNFLQVIPKIRDSYQLFFAVLGWAGCVIHCTQYAEDEGRKLYQKARDALSCVRHVDFGGVGNTIAILKEIDADSPWGLVDNIIQRQRTN